MVEISASFPTCHRYGLHISGGWARIVNPDGEWVLCYDPDKVSCYDHHLMDQKYGSF